ncbi:MAG: hypothetical protein QXS32_08870 [Candidatus Nezhaarchaeales archaeon]
MKLLITMRQEGWDFESLTKLLLVADEIRKRYGDKKVDVNIDILGETARVELWIRDEEGEE